MPETILIIACGALAREIRHLLPPERFPNVRLHCLPATLHNRPERIAPAMAATLAECAGTYTRAFAAYADCGTAGALDTLLQSHNIQRLPGAHCYAFFTGIDAFAQTTDSDLRSFYLTDFLARHFETLVWQGLGLDRHPHLRDSYFGAYERIVYLAQTDDPALTQCAMSAATMLGLDFERRQTGYGDLATSLNELVGEGA